MVPKYTPLSNIPSQTVCVFAEAPLSFSAALPVIQLSPQTCDVLVPLIQHVYAAVSSLPAHMTVSLEPAAVSSSYTHSDFPTTAPTLYKQNKGSMIS